MNKTGGNFNLDKVQQEIILTDVGKIIKSERLKSKVLLVKVKGLLEDFLTL